MTNDMIADMLALLREEFALEAPAAQETLTQWQATPSQVPEGAADMLSLIERFTQAVETVGFEGLSDTLAVIHALTLQIIERDEADANNSSSIVDKLRDLAWLSQWVGKVDTYLQNPSDLSAIENIVSYLGDCPEPVSEEQLLTITNHLMVLPSMSDEDAEEIALLDQAASEEDVALSTEDVDQELLFALLADAPQQLQDMEHAVAQWSLGICSEGDLQEAMRSAHTLKGSGSIIGLPGIGKLAHRLEDIMEYAVDGVRMGERPPEALARDVMQSVHCLQQMTSHLQGNEEAPTNAQAVLQNLLDWVKRIRKGEVDTPSVEITPSALITPSTDTALSTPIAPIAPRAPADVTAPYAAVNAPEKSPAKPATEIAKTQESAMLRVSVSQLSRLLRRAGQSIVHAERMAKLLSDNETWLNSLERSNQILAARLNELDALVNSQVTQLREAQQVDTSFDPLELDRYDALHGLSRFIGETARDSSAMALQAKEVTQKSMAILREENYALVDQHRELLTARMVPVKTIIPRLKRTVAQTAIATGRKVALHLTGEEVVVDADVLARMVEPLLHLLRNAVDHGIELPQTRQSNDKPEQGNIYLDFERHGEELVLRVSDDGRGLNLEAIEAKALDFGLILQAGELSEPELQRMILQPGFSTRDNVTETSGRGVGMDIVNDRITGLKGRLEIDSIFGMGSTFTVHVPVSSGVAHALIVQCAGETVAIPLEQVQSIVAAGVAQISVDDTNILVETGGKTYPTYSLAQWLELEDANADDVLKQAAKLIVVLAKGATGPVALLVDAVLESRELILQDVGLLTRRVRGIIGGALRSDGRPLFLLGISELQRAVNAPKKSTADLSMVSRSTNALRKRLQVERTRVLVVDDAWSVRRSMQQLLEDAGYEVATAADGFEALERLRTKRPDIVLTDLEMPNLNGLELARRMQEIPQWSAIPVVMITSRTSAKHREEGLKAGVDVYLTKPYLDADLIAQVRNLTAAKSKTLVDIAI